MCVYICIYIYIHIYTLIVGVSMSITANHTLQCFKMLSCINFYYFFKICADQEDRNEARK